ncbi:hypothetical protein MMC07_000004 [Pseudocyphellaria aurata]|nr:hypothetical protein [Pseudocyphellaria aurata]
MVVKYFIFPFTVQISVIGITGFMLSSQLQKIKTELGDFKTDATNQFAEGRADAAHTNRRLDEVYTILHSAPTRFPRLFVVIIVANPPEKTNEVNPELFSEDDMNFAMETGGKQGGIAEEAPEDVEEENLGNVSNPITSHGLHPRPVIFRLWKVKIILANGAYLMDLRELYYCRCTCILGVSLRGDFVIRYIKNGDPKKVIRVKDTRGIYASDAAPNTTSIPVITDTFSKTSEPRKQPPARSGPMPYIKSSITPNWFGWKRARTQMQPFIFLSMSVPTSVSIGLMQEQK